MSRIGDAFNEGWIAAVDDGHAYIKPWASGWGTGLVQVEVSACTDLPLNPALSIGPVEFTLQYNCEELPLSPSHPSQLWLPVNNRVLDPGGRAFLDSFNQGKVAIRLFRVETRPLPYFVTARTHPKRAVQRFCGAKCYAYVEIHDPPSVGADLMELICTLLIHPEGAMLARLSAVVSKLRAQPSCFEPAGKGWALDSVTRSAFHGVHRKEQQNGWDMNGSASEIYSFAQRQESTPHSLSYAMFDALPSPAPVKDTETHWVASIPLRSFCVLPQTDDIRGGIIACDPNMGQERCLMLLSRQQPGTGNTPGEQHLPTLFVGTPGKFLLWSSDASTGWETPFRSHIYRQGQSLDAVEGAGLVFVSYDDVALLPKDAVWDRVVVDEIHLIGGNQSVLEACIAIQARNRWVLSSHPELYGTESLRNLLGFLRVQGSESIPWISLQAEERTEKGLAVLSIGPLVYGLFRKIAIHHSYDPNCFGGADTICTTLHTIQLESAQQRDVLDRLTTAASTKLPTISVQRRKRAAKTLSACFGYKRINLKRLRSLFDIDTRTADTEGFADARTSCSICHSGSMQDPVQLPCRHCFCHGCYLKLQSFNHTRCPVCRQGFDTSEVVRARLVQSPPGEEGSSTDSSESIEAMDIEGEPGSPSSGSDQDSDHTLGVPKALTDEVLFDQKVKWVCTTVCLHLRVCETECQPPVTTMILCRSQGTAKQVHRQLQRDGIGHIFPVAFDALEWQSGFTLAVSTLEAATWSGILPLVGRVFLVESGEDAVLDAFYRQVGRLRNSASVQVVFVALGDTLDEVHTRREVEKRSSNR
jgi:hypothetical protein